MNRASMAKKPARPKAKKAVKKPPRPSKKKRVVRRKDPPKPRRPKAKRSLPKKKTAKSANFIQRLLWPLTGLALLAVLVGGLRASLNPGLPEPVKPETVAKRATAPVTEPPPVREREREPQYSGPLGAEFLAARDKSVGERIAFWSQYLISDPNSSSELAAIPGLPSLEDTAPVVPKKFDCSTYVETVAALAKSDEPAEFFRNLLGIRYREGRPTFGSRNHFPEADWIPNNAAAGNLADVTREVAGSAGVAVGVESKVIDRAGWFARNMRKSRVRALASVDQDYAEKPGEARLPYIPVAQLERVLPRIPSGTVLNLVREDNPRKEVLITHQGFVIQEGGKTYFRHARPPGKIRTDELWAYLQKLQKRPDYRSWPLLGVNLNWIIK